MGNLDPAIRRRVAALAADFYDGRLTYEAFLMALPSVDAGVDDEVTELLDLIEHKSARGPVLGVTLYEHARYVSDIRRRIAELSA
jgi:hypothetical protein